MTEQEFRRLQLGDVILDKDGEIGCVCGFGRLENGQWVRSSRERCTAVQIWFPRLDERSYIGRGLVEELVLTRQEAQELERKMYGLLGMLRHALLKKRGMERM